MDRTIAKTINKIKNETIEIIKTKTGQKPELGVIRVGNKPDQLSYEKSLKRTLSSLDIIVRIIEFEQNVLQEDILVELDKLNEDKSVNGILVLLPLDSNCDSNLIVNSIAPTKDVDCLSDSNIINLLKEDETFYVPCAARAVVSILDIMNVTFEGLNITVVGSSVLVGKPLILMLIRRGATVTVANKYTKNLQRITSTADVVVSAAGKEKLITKNHVDKNSIVIDVGINIDAYNKVVGDVDYYNVEPFVKYVTPVPNGVGAITNYILASNVVKAYLKQNHIN